MVTDHLSNRPLPRASVRIRHLRGKVVNSTTTDDQGQFEFCSLARGPYSLTASAAGFSSVDGIAASIVTILVSKAPSVVKADLTLFPLLEVAGTVLSPEGAPLANIVVDALIRIENQGPVMWRKVWSGATRPDGSFRAEKLLPGKYLFTTSEKSGRGGAETIQAGVNFYPAGGGSTALPVEVVDTQPRSIRIEHPPQSDTCHTINVTLSADVPSRDEVSLVLTVTALLHKGKVDIADRIISGGGRRLSVCGLPSGTYGFEVSGTAGTSLLVSASDTVTVSREKATVINLAAVVNAPLRISVVAPVQPSSAPFDCASKRTVVLTPVDRRSRPGEKSEIQLSKDCTALFPSVLAGTYQVLVIPLPEGYYIKNIESDDYDSTDHYIEVGTSARRDGVKIEIKEGTGRLVTSISNREEIKDLRPLAVLVFKHNDDGSLCATCVTASAVVADETFEISTLAAGTYSLVVVKELPASPAGYSNLISQVSRSLTSATVIAGQQRQVSVKYIEIDQRLLSRMEGR
ncbi:MAG: carboxypeptidase regulatory-like domain-containing protein [Brevundimonas sp.]|nr:carboxypeptidase regulatory-like domain-containing protein [Acidobacteriaceae bacterium]MCA3718881.1 carboxypeptidase regulatory-like domain-containing protein [Brevundimonas sp.]